MEGSDLRHVRVRAAGIRLGQLLKLAGVATSGADAKALVEEGGVTVNGAPERRRGRRLADGDVVAAAGERLRVAVEP